MFGLGASTSHGVAFNNNYIGLGLEIAESTLPIFTANAWLAAYADYRYLFNVGNAGNSIFIQAAPGVVFSNESDILLALFKTKEQREADAKKPVTKSLYVKFGAGFQWNWTHTGLGIGLYCSYFAIPNDDKVQHYFPSMALTFHW